MEHSKFSKKYETKNKIYLYKNSNNATSKKVEQWLHKHHFSYQLLSSNNLNETHLFQILRCSEGRFDEILKSKTTVRIENSTTKELVQEILKKTVRVKKYTL